MNGDRCPPLPLPLPPRTPMVIVCHSQRVMICSRFQRRETNRQLPYSLLHSFIPFASSCTFSSALRREENLPSSFLVSFSPNCIIIASLYVLNDFSYLNISFYIFYLKKLFILRDQIYIFSTYIQTSFRSG